MKWLLALFALIACVFAPRALMAVPFEVKAAQGSLPLELHVQGSSFSGKLAIANRSDRVQKLEISLREGGPIDPRLPYGSTVKLGSGGTNLVLKPGETRDAEVSIPIPKVGPRPSELWGHVMVTAEGEAPTVAGFHLPADSSSKLLSFALLFPMLGAIVLLVLGMRGASREMRRNAFIVSAVAELALLAWVASKLDPSLTRFSGGEGIQLVERVALSRSMGLEYFLAVDGVSLPIALIVPLVVLAAALVAPSKSFDQPRVWPLVLVLEAAALGLVFSFDLAFAFVFWIAVVLVTTLLVRIASNDAGSARALGVQLAVASVLFGFVFWQLATRATPAYLADGTAVYRSFSLIELSHGGLTRTAPLFGMHPVKVVFGALFVGSWIVLGAPPFHFGIGGAVTRLPASFALVVAGIVPTLGLLILLRVGYLALPDGIGWAAPTVATIGVVSALLAALAAVGAGELRRFTSYACAAQSGLCLLALGSTTAIGVQAMLTLAVSRALFATMLLAIAAIVRDRVGTTDTHRLGGLASEFPAFGALSAIAFWAAAAGPGTSTFVGVLQTVAGTLPTSRFTAVVATVVLAIGAAASVRAFSRMFLGSFPDALRRSPALEPHAGRFPLLEEREATALVALAILLVGLGLWTRPLLRVTDSSCLDYAEFVNKPGVLEVT